MTSWLHASLRTFLGDRILLYEICEACRVFPGLISPTHFYKLDRKYSDAICAQIDQGLAQYVRWYEARKEERKKSGKHKWESKYKDLNELLGVTEELRRGGWNDGSELKEVSYDYKTAVIDAIAAGKPVPDVEEWLAAQADDTEEEDFSD